MQRIASRQNGRVAEYRAAARGEGSDPLFLLGVHLVTDALDAGHARVGLGAIGTPRLLFPIFGLSLLQWLVFLGCVAFSLRAVDVPVTLASAVSVLLLNVIGLTLPAAPGHVGTVQIAFVVSLAPFGVTQEQAFAASVVYNFLIVVPTVILGFPGLRQSGAALRERILPG